MTTIENQQEEPRRDEDHTEDDHRHDDETLESDIETRQLRGDSGRNDRVAGDTLDHRATLDQPVALQISSPRPVAQEARDVHEMDRGVRRVLIPGPPIRFHSTDSGRARGGQIRYHEAMQSFQRFFITEALLRYDWNVARTAREIGIQRSHLYKIMKSHALVRPKKQTSRCGK